MFNAKKYFEEKDDLQDKGAKKGRPQGGRPVVKEGRDRGDVWDSAQ